METFADYILSEQDYMKKMEIVYYLKKKANIFYDNSVILKTELAKMFMETMEIDVDRNLVLTASLLCACKKSDNPQDLSKVKSYAKESAKFLKTLGFSDRFCKICEEQNRYSGSLPREKESDILELVDNFGGMLMHRPERIGFTVDEAICLLQYRNLKGKDNIYLDKFVRFVDTMKEVKVSEYTVINESTPYITHLGRIVNDANDINKCLDGILSSRDLLTNAKKKKIIEKEQEEKNNIIPEKLVEEIKQNMKQGKEISSAIIYDNSFEVNVKEDN